MARLKINSFFKDVDNQIQCTSNVLMPCGKVIEGTGLRDDRKKAENVAGNILRENVRVHKANCKRGCNPK